MLPPRPISEQEKRIVIGLLAIGATRRMAAQYAGCRLADLLAARRDDREFAAQLRRAAYQPEIKILRTLLDTACDPKQWRAACWMLERMYSQRYGTRAAKTLKQRDLDRFLKQVRKTLEGAIPAGDAREDLLQRLTSLQTREA